MKKISVVISAYNEEENIKECLDSIQWADEIILVDNQSTDKTTAIAKQYTKKIFSRPNNPMLNINKNFGFSKASGDWILNLDADERVTTGLQKEIIALEPEPRVDGYLMPRKNIIFGKWIEHGLWWPDYQLRFFRAGRGKFPCVYVHEKINVKGRVDKLKEPLLHYNYQTVSQFIQKLDKIYTENEAENLLKSGKKIAWGDAIRMPVSDFLSVFFAREGYKDGLHGLVLAMLQAFYRFVVFAKVWEKEKFWQYDSRQFLEEISSELKKTKKEAFFWLAQKSESWRNKLLLKIKSSF